MLFIASVSTVLFNGNPLLRFDGYYILSDMVDIPNLHIQARQHLGYMIERFAFGVKKSQSPVDSNSERVFLTIFGILSTVYRVMVFAGILLVVASKFLLAGLVMAVFCIFSWLIFPLWKFGKYLFGSPKLERTRVRAVAVSAAIATVVVALLQFIPFPYHVRTAGVVKALNHPVVYNLSAGRISTIVQGFGTYVEAGEVLVELANPELNFKIEALHAQQQEVAALKRRALQKMGADLKTLIAQMELLQKHLFRLQEQKEALIVRAPLPGLWTGVGPQLKEGAWIARGTVLGRVIDPTDFTFHSVIPQQDVKYIFARDPKGAEVRLRGDADSGMKISGVELIPADQERLPSSALGWYGGGSIAVDRQDTQGIKAEEPFFLIRAHLENPYWPTSLHGRSGYIRFKFDSEPLLAQWFKKLRQLLQKRYRL